MHTHYLLRIIAVIAASAATVSLASAAAAQDDGGTPAAECGAGVIEVCGEITTYECGWEWEWTFTPFFPYRGYVPLYTCDVALRNAMYRHTARSGRAGTEY